MLVLKSINEEITACRERCKDLKIGDNVLHLHHEVLIEKLTEPIENRILYILKNKTDNVALRLRLISPLIIDEKVLEDNAWIKAETGWNKARADRNKAHADRIKAHADRIKAHDYWITEEAAWNKAKADWHKACDDWDKTYADWNKAYLPHYYRLFPDSPWNGYTIFANGFEI